MTFFPLVKSFSNIEEFFYRHVNLFLPLEKLFFLTGKIDLYFESG